MPNPACRGNGERSAAMDGAAPIAARETIEFRNPVDETKIVVPLSGSHHDEPGPIEKMWSTPEFSKQKRFDRDERYADDVGAGGNRATEQPRETSSLCGFLRFTGTVVGLLMGGPAGAALGSVVGEVAGDIATGRSNNIWPKLRLIGFWRTRLRTTDHPRSSADVDRSMQDD
jgi:hypothetical protein